MCISYWVTFLLVECSLERHALEEQMAKLVAYWVSLSLQSCWLWVLSGSMLELSKKKNVKEVIKTLGYWTESHAAMIGSLTNTLNPQLLDCILECFGRLDLNLFLMYTLVFTWIIPIHNPDYKFSLANNTKLPSTAWMTMIWHESCSKFVIALRTSDTTRPIDGKGGEIIQTDKIRLPTSETAFTELLI